MSRSSSTQPELPIYPITLSALHLPPDISTLHQQSGIQFHVPASNASSAVRFNAIISESTSENLILQSFHSAHVEGKSFDGVGYPRSSLKDLGVSKCAFGSTIDVMLGQSRLYEPFKVDGAAHVPFTFRREEFESQFVAVLGRPFLEWYMIQTRWTSGGWTVELPSPLQTQITELVIYTDGCCLHNGSPQSEDPESAIPRGGYGIHFPDFPKGWDMHGALSGRQSHTNQKAELTALIRALQLVKARGIPCESIQIFTDSQYAVQGLNDFVPKWRQNEYRNKRNLAVINTDLFKALDAEVSAFNAKRIPVTLVHVPRGENKVADALSKLGATGDQQPRPTNLQSKDGRPSLLMGRPLMDKAKPLVQWSPDGMYWVQSHLFDDVYQNGAANVVDV